MVLQPKRQTTSNIAIRSCELLPHFLTLTPTNRSGYFLLCYYTLANISPFESLVLFVARTFLFITNKLKRSDGTAYCNANLSYLLVNHLFLPFILFLFFTTQSQRTLTCLPTGRVSLRLPFTTNCKMQLPLSILLPFVFLLLSCFFSLPLSHIEH